MSVKEKALRAIAELPDDADYRAIAEKLDSIRLVEEGRNQTTPAGQALRSLNETLIKNALSQYAQGELSPGQAAELAGLNRWDFADIAKQRGINTPYTLEMLEEDFANGSRH